MKELVVLAADKNIEHTLKGLLVRPQSLGIQPIEADIFIEPEHDPACALRGVSFLSNFSNEYKHALLVFDHEGSGKESVQAHELQEGINAEFANSTWGRERARAIVLAPELETWIWSDSPHVDEITGWKNRQPGLRPWLTEQGWFQEGQVKPALLVTRPGMTPLRKSRRTKSGYRSLRWTNQPHLMAASAGYAVPRKTTTVNIA